MPFIMRQTLFWALSHFLHFANDETSHVNHVKEGVIRPVCP